MGIRGNSVIYLLAVALAVFTTSGRAAAPSSAGSAGSSIVAVLAQSIESKASIKQSSPIVATHAAPADLHGATATESTKQGTAPAEDLIARYTLWLAVFTFILAVVGGVEMYFLIRTDHTARVAAEAAKRSADSLPNVERAYVFVERINFSNADNGKIAVAIRFKNVGKTPAIVMTLFSGISRELQSKPPYDNPPSQLHRVIPTNQTLIYNVELEESKMPNAKYFYGRIQYADIFRQGRATWFCYEVVTGDATDSSAGGVAFNSYF